MIRSQKELENKIKDKEERTQIQSFKKTLNTHLLTSRFNTITREQNEIYRKTNWKNGCLYCAPVPINKDIPIGSKIIVLEMDNDINQIFALGLLTNKPFTSRFSVYDDHNYNRYNYTGRYRINREDCTDEEEAILQMLDFMCFKGNYHMKRGQGLTAFPLKIIWKLSESFQLIEFLETMFKTRFSKENK
jgi:hypothetical protein